MHARRRAIGRASIQAKAKKHAKEVAPEIQTARAKGFTSLRQVAPGSMAKAW
jgi:hypothetical protein